MHHNKIDSLQLLRAIAVSFVIFVHSANFGVPIISSVNPTDSFYNSKTWGTIGVDLFFCISGFIMTIIIHAYTKSGGWKLFLKKRFIRIVPLYYLLSLIDALSTVYLKHETIDFATISKTLLFFPIFDKKEFVTPLISVGWTLSFEMYFYTLIAILLIFKRDIYKRLLFVILFLGVTGLFTNSESPILKFLTTPLLFEFGFGIVCGLLYRKFNSSGILISVKKAVSIILLVIGLSLMCYTFFIPDKYLNWAAGTIENNNISAFYRTLTWGIPCALVLLGVTFSELVFRKKIPKILILAGDASYSCYLIHMKIFPIIAHVFKYLSLGSILFLIAVVPLCIIVSIIFYKIVEKPLITGTDSLFQYKKPVMSL